MDTEGGRCVLPTWRWRGAHVAWKYLFAGLGADGWNFLTIWGIGLLMEWWGF